MGRRSKFAHLKPSVIAAFESGRSLAEVLGEHPDIPRGTVYHWHKNWRSETGKKSNGNDLGQFGQIRATQIEQGFQSPPPPHKINKLVALRGGDQPLIQSPELRKIWGRLEHLMFNPGDGKEAIAAAQVANALVRILDTDRRLAEAPNLTTDGEWTEADQWAYENWDKLTDDERAQRLSEALSN